MQFRKDSPSGNYSEDISFGQLIIVTIVTLVISVFVVAFLSWIIYEATESTRKNTINNNKASEILNKLSVEEREFMAERLSLSIDEETGLVTKNELLDIDRFESGVIAVEKILLLLAVLVVPSIAASINYEQQKSGSFYYADFPFRGAKRFFFVALIWVSWPAILVSRRRIKQKQRKQIYQAETAKKAGEDLRTEYDARLAELGQNTPVEFYSDELLEQIIQSEFARNMSPTALIGDTDIAAYREGFSMAANSWQNGRVKSLCDAVQRKEKDLKKYGRQIQEIQQDLGHIRAELREIGKQQSQPRTPPSDEVAKRDLTEILTMRGVTELKIQNPDRESVEFHIMVCVRIPYQGLIYDIGDYRINITIYDGHQPRYSATPVRKGSFYQRGGEFCFGRDGDIRRQLQNGNIVAAVAIMIDGMHYINHAHDYERIIEHYRPIHKLSEIRCPVEE